MYDAKLEEVTEYTVGKFVDPSMESMARRVVGITTLLTNSPKLKNNQLKEGLLERMLVMARSDEYIQHLVASKAIITASCKKKDMTAVVSKGLDIFKSLCKSDNEQIKSRALVGLCKLAQACRRFLINPAGGHQQGQDPPGARSGITQGSASVFPDQRDCDVVRPIAPPPLKCKLFEIYF